MGEIETVPCYAPGIWRYLLQLLALLTHTETEERSLRGGSKWNSGFQEEGPIPSTLSSPRHGADKTGQQSFYRRE